MLTSSPDAPPAPGVHPLTSILVRFPPKTATKWAPPQCLVRRHILTRARHPAGANSSEAAGHQACNPLLTTPENTTHYMFGAVTRTPRSVHSHFVAFPRYDHLCVFTDMTPAINLLSYKFTYKEMR